MKFKKISALCFIIFLGFFLYHIVCVNQLEKFFQQNDKGQMSISINPLTNWVTLKLSLPDNMTDNPFSLFGAQLGMSMFGSMGTDMFDEMFNEYAQGQFDLYSYFFPYESKISTGFGIGKNISSPSGTSKTNKAKTLSLPNEKKITIKREKQAYIPKIDLYDLTGKYHKTYLDEKVPGVEFKLKNNGDKALRKVEVTVYFKNKDGIVICEENFHPVLITSFSSSSDKPLKPNYIWQMESGHFYKADSVPSEWDEGNIEAKITDIEFEERNNVEQINSVENQRSGL